LNKVDNGMVHVVLSSVQKEEPFIISVCKNKLDAIEKVKFLRSKNKGIPDYWMESWKIE